MWSNVLIARSNLDLTGLITNTISNIINMINILCLL